MDQKVEHEKRVERLLVRAIETLDDMAEGCKVEGLTSDEAILLVWALADRQNIKRDLFTTQAVARTAAGELKKERLKREDLIDRMGQFRLLIRWAKECPTNQIRIDQIESALIGKTILLESEER
jgi:hypothetical protein